MPGMTGRDIVCLSTQDWGDLWTRKQRFMKMFAEAGNRVLYIETPVHLLGLDVLPHDRSRFFRFLSGPRRVSDGLHVATLPVLLPFFQMSHRINRANHVWIRKLIRQWTSRLRFKNPLFWIYTPFSAPILEGFDVDSVYECVDEFRAAKGLISPAIIAEMEDNLLRKVRMTVVTHENLLPHRARLCPDTFHIPNAADTGRLREAALGRFDIPDDIAQIPHPRFGFVGYIHYWIDVELIRFLAAKRPDWSFILIGPKSRFANLASLRSHRNVHVLGRKPESTIPSYLQAFDCCINPYVTGPLADHCNPLKLYEYVAAGKPVVSTDMPSARKFTGEVDIASSYDQFLKLCGDRIAQLPEPRSTIERRLKVAEPHSWESRFNQLNVLLDRVFAV
jgi:glycosyltransferase involved in cell wall biosynthesis